MARRVRGEIRRMLPPEGSCDRRRGVASSIATAQVGAADAILSTRPILEAAVTLAGQFPAAHEFQGREPDGLFVSRLNRFDLTRNCDEAVRAHVPGAATLGLAARG